MFVAMKEFLQRDVIRHTMIVYGGSFINSAALFLANVIVARLLSVESMGVFTIALLTLGAVTEMSDVGLNAGLTRFVPVFEVHQSRAKLQWLFHTVRRFRIWFSIGITSVGCIFSSAIAEHIFHRPEIASMLRISFLGVGGVILLGFAVTYLQASQRFVLSSTFNAVKGISRLLFVLALYVYGNTSVLVLLAGYILLPWALAVIAYSFIPQEVRKQIPSLDISEVQTLRSELFHFSSFMTLWSVVAIIASRVDQVMISRYMTLEDVALYGVAMQCTLGLSLLSQAITTVLAPRLHRLESFSDVQKLIRKTFLCLCPLLGVLFCIIYPTQWLLPIFFGESYRSAMHVYLWLMYSMAFTFISIPFYLLLTYFRKTHIIAYSALFQLALVIVLNTSLIPRFGLIGAGMTFALVTFLVQLYTMSFALYYYRVSLSR